MKRLFLLICMIILCIHVYSQNVGIGTTTPYSSAILDLTTTNKGLLLPRLTESQRISVNERKGMVVYDSTYDRVYYSDGAGWQYFLDNTYWARNAAGTSMSNTGVNVGIGTSSPNASAKLHVNSTTQGFLPPVMTSTQRTNISSPAEGLMVYETTSDRMYQYQGGAWKILINNDYWASNGTDVYNGTANIGIGTAAPSEKLHVNGNARITGDLINTGEIRINNTSAILQLQSASVNTGFVQLSGDNLRLGTNSGNTTGDLVIRMNGTDRVFIDEAGRMGIGTSSLTSRLHVSGDIDVSDDVILTNNSSITRPVTGSFNLLPVAYGRVGFMALTNTMTPNVTVARTSQGVYEISAPQFTSTTVILITMNEYQGSFYAYPNVAHLGGIIYRIHFYNTNGQLLDAGFSFLAYQL